MAARLFYTEFRHTIRHELVHVFQLSIMTQVAQRYPRLRHASFPLWWTEGGGEFWSAGEDSRYQMILRDMTVSGRARAARPRPPPPAWAGGAG